MRYRVWTISRFSNVLSTSKEPSLLRDSDCLILHLLWNFIIDQAPRLFVVTCRDFTKNLPVASLGYVSKNLTLVFWVKRQLFALYFSWHIMHANMQVKNAYVMLQAWFFYILTLASLLSLDSCVQMSLDSALSTLFLLIRNNLLDTSTHSNWQCRSFFHCCRFLFFPGNPTIITRSVLDYKELLKALRVHYHRTKLLVVLKKVQRW